MNYKLLLADIDGTLTHNLGMPARKFLPSVRLKKAVRYAKKLIQISLCTGRDTATVLQVARTLHLNTPLIIEGGTKIIDAKGNEIWARYLVLKSAEIIIELLRSFESEFSIIVEGIELFNQLPEPRLKRVSAVLIYDLSPYKISILKKQLVVCRDLSLAFNQDRLGNTVYITHKDGTKSHGVKRLLKLLSINKSEVIGIGDGNNDIPLLMECGFKVAMGNAVPELKAIADYIAPDVENDGVAHVLVKFILKKNLNIVTTVLL